jgi:UDP-N-acetylglucosamine 1-carboxyvinyltransferase
MITESIFEKRFGYVEELNRMGADITVCEKGDVATINGVKGFVGTDVTAPDLRAGAALVIAGLCAKGYTSVSDIKYVLRGYEDFDVKMQKLGAQIVTVSDEKEAEEFIRATSEKESLPLIKQA